MLVQLSPVYCNLKKIISNLHCGQSNVVITLTFVISAVLRPEIGQIA